MDRLEKNVTLYSSLLCKSIALYVNSSKKCLIEVFLERFNEEEKRNVAYKEVSCVLLRQCLVEQPPLTRASKYTLVHWTCLALSPAKTIGLPRTSKYSYVLKKS